MLVTETITARAQVSRRADYANDKFQARRWLRHKWDTAQISTSRIVFLEYKENQFQNNAVIFKLRKQPCYN